MSFYKFLKLSYNQFFRVPSRINSWLNVFNKILLYLQLLGALNMQKFFRGLSFQCICLLLFYESSVKFIDANMVVN
jgi:hypothetical protein